LNRRNKDERGWEDTRLSQTNRSWDMQEENPVHGVLCNLISSYPEVESNNSSIIFNQRDAQSQLLAAFRLVTSTTLP